MIYGFHRLCMGMLYACVPGGVCCWVWLVVRGVWGEVWGLCGGLTVGLCCFLMIAYNIVSYYFRVMKRNTKHVN